MFQLLIMYFFNSMFELLITFCATAIFNGCPDNCPRGKLHPPPRLGLGFGLELTLKLGLESNFHRGQLS